MVTRPARWVNATVVGFALTSFLSDVSHEMATAILPIYIGSLGLGALTLGIVEGVADFLNGAAKLVGGVAGQRLARKKPVTAACYAVTAVGTAGMGFVASLPALAGMRGIAWIGRGFRGPLRDFLMSDAVEPTHYGRAYGLERAGDMVGAVIGPLIALGLAAAAIEFHRMLLLAIVPGLAAAACVLFVVREKPFRPPGAAATLRGMHGALPAGYWRLVAAILAFGMGDFSRSFLILAAAQAMGAESVGLGFVVVGVPVALYAMHNMVSAMATFPSGRAADGIGRKRVLAAGYGLGLVCNVILAAGHASIALVALAFVISGIYIAVEETVEKALVAELIPRDVRAYGLGILAGANAVGDMVASVCVGLLWSRFGAGPAFTAAAICSAVGFVLLLAWRRPPEDRKIVAKAA